MCYPAPLSFQEGIMKHLADHGRLRGNGRLRAFLRLARQGRGFWHRSEAAGSGRRVVEFMRIVRGR